MSVASQKKNSSLFETFQTRVYTLFLFNLSYLVIMCCNSFHHQVILKISRQCCMKENSYGYNIAIFHAQKDFLLKNLLSNFADI